MNQTTVSISPDLSIDAQIKLEAAELAKLYRDR